MYVLRRSVRGYRYQWTLRARNVQEAEEELAKFLRDPISYRPTPREECSARIGPDLVEEYCRYLAELGKTPAYIEDGRRYLPYWAEAFGGKSLGDLSPLEVRRVAASWATSRKTRIIVFKAFCSWLVNRGLLDENANPGRALKVPPSRPARALRTKGYEMAVVERVYQQIRSPAIRDVVCALAKTGMHRSELERIAGGEAEVREVRAGRIAGVLRFTHKSGRVHLLSVDAQVLGAVQRLRARGSLPSKAAICESLGRIHRNTGLPYLRLGELRHSFVAWATTCGELVSPVGQGGVPLEQVASVLGHTNTRTTRLFYAVAEVPQAVMVPIRLVHPDDDNRPQQNESVEADE